MIPYLLNVALMLTGCLCFYKILLRRETFYKLNRLVLAACLVLSFSLPLIPVPQQWSFWKAEQVETFPVPTLQSPAVLEHLNESQQSTEQKKDSATLANVEAAPDYLQKATKWAVYIYWFGVIAFALNFLVQLILLLYKAYRLPYIQDGKYRIVELSGNEAPCSFGHFIFINPEKYDWDTYNQILLHEKIHIQQQHTADILLAELVLIFQWFNPFAWIYRKEVESNLEFLTDEKLLENPEIDRTSYQMSILKVSAPQLPLSLTTNYNQSLLKKRITMMNAKKSNMNTSWKYGFIIPMLVLFVTLLNKPIANAQDNNAGNTATKKETARPKKSFEYEGVWFATIKGEKVTVQFKSDEENEFSTNSSGFALTDFEGLKSNSNGPYTLKREAGSMLLTGKFEGDQGMGQYKFTPNAQYVSAMEKEGIDTLSENDKIVFFFVDVKTEYVKMLKRQGYTKIGKMDLIPMAALKIDENYISSWKTAGYKDISMRDLIPLKSLKIDQAYAKEIKDAGFKDVTPHQLISFKAQGIDGKYIAGLKKSNAFSKDKNEPTPNDVISFKAMDVDEEYVKTFADAGYKDLASHQLVAMKAQKITPEYIKSFEAVGMKDIPVNQVIAFKSLGITPEYVKHFTDLGYKLNAGNITAAKSLGITEEFIKSYETAGFKNIPMNDVIALKSQNIPASAIKAYQDLGFADVSIHQIISAKAMGVTPDFIQSMKQKGHDLKSLQKYIQLKNALD